jgi:hypothetical protein
VSKIHISLPVAHACNSSYSGGRDQEDHSLKPTWANSSQDPISKIPSQIRASEVVQGVGPKFKSQYCEKKKKKKRGKMCGSFGWLLTSVFKYFFSFLGKGKCYFMTSNLNNGKGLNMRDILKTVQSMLNPYE